MDITSFVPKELCKLYVKGDAPPSPFVTQTEAACMVADLSGFTKLSERLCRKGPAGADELSLLLDDYFAKMINVILAAGGDICKFAGDAPNATRLPGGVAEVTKASSSPKAAAIASR